MITSGIGARITLLISALLCCATSARADWINLTGAETAPNIAEIYVLDDRVRVLLEVYVGDLDRFMDLVPDDWLQDSSGRPGLQERLRQFSTSGLQILTGTGERLGASLVVAEPRLRVDRKSPFAGMINPMTRRRVPEAPADKRVMYVELEYPFTSRPDELTIVPPLDEDNGMASTTIGFIAYHKAVPIIDFRYLGAASELTLDWDDPWYSKFKNPNLKRHHASALMTFLYVEPYEVRHEVLTRVKDLEEWMDLGLRGERFIEIDELDGLKRRIGDFMLARNPVRIDGEAVAPILERMNYVTVGVTGIQLLEVPERLEVSTAIVGVILTYLTDGIPQQVTVDWELFTDQVQRVPATATDPAGPLPTFVTPDDPVHTWTNYLKKYKLPAVEAIAIDDALGELRVPIASVVCLALALPLGWQLRRRSGRGVSAGRAVALFAALAATAVAAYPYARVSLPKPAFAAGQIADEEAATLLHALLRNVYRAFDFRAEEDVYDKLAISVDGELLADIYLENRRAFAVKQAGGAQAKVKAVEILSAGAERADRGSLRYRLNARWTATGTVGHWGHVHTRQNLYDAIVTVAAVDGSWKITGLEVLEESRIDPSATAASTRRPTSDQTAQ